MIILSGRNFKFTSLCCIENDTPLFTYSEDTLNVVFMHSQIDSPAANNTFELISSSQFSTSGITYFVNNYQGFTRCITNAPSVYIRGEQMIRYLISFSGVFVSSLFVSTVCIIRNSHQIDQSTDFNEIKL